MSPAAHSPSKPSFSASSTASFGMPIIFAALNERPLNMPLSFVSSTSAPRASSRLTSMLASRSARRKSSGVCSPQIYRQRSLRASPWLT